jgi:hypothetical protein
MLLFFGGCFLLKSIHSRSDCSRAIQVSAPWAVCDAEDAQQSVPHCQSQFIRSHSFIRFRCRVNVLSIADIGPIHGLASRTVGRWTFSFFTVCSRTGLIAVEAPRAGMMGVDGRSRRQWRAVIALRCQ